ETGQQSVRLARHLPFPRDPARVIHNADARVLDRNVQSRKIVHAALLLLMLGARTTVTPFHHQPEAQHPKSSAIHNNAGRLPHLLTQSGHRYLARQPLSWCWFKPLRCSFLSLGGGNATTRNRHSSRRLGARLANPSPALPAR